MSDNSAGVTQLSLTLPGIAGLIKTRQLEVPEYQRSYSWFAEKEGEQVKEFWTDLTRAFHDTKSDYFLGTVVLTSESGSDRRTVIDGQQRLATTSLLIAAARDELDAVSHKKASVLAQDYLAKETLDSDGAERRLRLNLEDDEYFAGIVEQGVVAAPDPKVPSQSRLRDSYNFLRARLHKIVEKDGAEELIDFIKFLETRAQVAVIEVPTESDAYTIFETLNDRGADLTIADLLKNYLYGRATPDKIAVVKKDWNTAVGALSLTAADAKFVAFIRHYWSSREGSTTEKRLYASIRGKVQKKAEAARLAKNLAAAAVDYAALGNASHPRWAPYGTAVRADIALIARFNLAPNRILMLAALDSLSQAEMKKLFPALVNWSVRGVVAETMNAKSTEESYAAAAVKIRAGTIKTVAALRTELISAIPSNADFKAAFAIAKISKTRGRQARYYLGQLELEDGGKIDPQLIPNPDENSLNLEHVLPQNAKPAEWSGITSEDDVATWAYRLGNMVLLTKGENSTIGNGPFSSKKAVLAASELQLTVEVGKARTWTPRAITTRQARLAGLAVTRWPR